MIPEFQSDGSLPPGIHRATLAEVAERFGENAHRRRLLDGLQRAIDVLQVAGCPTIYLDGSFVTTKPLPNDFDACWVYDEVDIQMLDAELIDNAAGWRERQKARYGGEFYAVHSHNVLRRGSMIAFFQANREPGSKKGIIAIDLRASQ